MEGEIVGSDVMIRSECSCRNRHATLYEQAQEETINQK